MTRDKEKNYSLGQLSIAQQGEAERQISIDLAYRSLPGTFMYLVGWFFLFFVIMARVNDDETRQFLFVVSVVVVAGALLRIGLVFLARKIVEFSKLSRLCLAIGVLINSVTWGVIAACAFIDTPLAPHSQIILLTTAGLSAGGAVSFSVSRLFTGMFLAGMLMPSILVELFIAPEINYEVLMAVSLYFAGMFMVTINPHREYIKALVSNIMLSELSNTDALTGLRNRRVFDEKLHEEVQRAKRSSSPVTLLLLDIDHFKKINDEYGHPAGDYCIQRVAQCIQSLVGRVSDTIARYGGEEFAVILPDTSSAESLQIAERIRLTVASQEFEYGQEKIPLTISIGFCTGADMGMAMQADSLLSHADKALYRAKKNGRNCVEQTLLSDDRAKEVAK